MLHKTRDGIQQKDRQNTSEIIAFETCACILIVPTPVSGFFQA